MKKILAIVTLVILGASAAQAQYHRGPRGPQPVHSGYDRYRSYAINDLQREVRERIDFGVASRYLSKREARRYMREYNRIAEREQHYRRRGGLNPSETRELVVALENLKREVPFDVRNNRRGGRDWARH